MSLWRKSSDVFKIGFIGCFIHCADVVIDGSKVFKIPPVDEAIFGNIVGDVAGSPIDGDGTGSEAIKDFFSDIAFDIVDVFIADVEAVIL